MYHFHVMKTTQKQKWLLNILEMWRALFRNPLTRNGYALVTSAALTSIFGFVFWILAARFYTKEELGVSAALISMLFTLGGLAQLNLGNILNRYLPTAGHQTTKLIIASYAIASAMALFTSTVFIISVKYFAPHLGFLSDDVQTALLFVFSAVLWTIFTLQDSVLSGLRQSIWVPLENIIYSVSKIALLLLPWKFIFMDSPVFTAWTVPLLLLVVGANLIIFFRLIVIPRPADLTGPTVLKLKTLIRFFGWDYVGTIATTLSYGATKLIVLNLSGPEALAVFYLAWTVSYSLYLATYSMSTSLIAEGAVDHDRLRILASDTIVHTMFVLVVGVSILLVAAPLIMSMFGPRYSEMSVGLLRILVLGSLPGALVTIYLAVARLEGHLSMVALVQVALFALVVGIGTLLTYLLGAVGMAYAWLVANSVTALGIACYVIGNRGKRHALEWLESLQFSVQRQLSSLKGHEKLPGDEGAKNQDRVT
jgi:O-antigen/teichoic acid export membrane protein